MADFLPPAITWNMKEQTEAKLTAEIKLSIHEAVESRLKELPATTYQLIEKIIEDRVAKAEKVYYKILGVVIASFLFAGLVFFHATSQNASEKVSEAIAKSALGDKLKSIDDAYSKIQTMQNQVNSAGTEALASAIKITAKLKELENQDNIVRLSHNGNLVLNLQDGDLRIRRKNPDKEIMMLVDKDGHLQISDGSTWFDVLHAHYLMSEGGTTKVNK